MLLVAALPHAWCYMLSTWTVWPGVCILWLGEIANLILTTVLAWQHIQLSKVIHLWDTLKLVLQLQCFCVNMAPHTNGASTSVLAWQHIQLSKMIIVIIIIMIIIALKGAIQGFYYLLTVPQTVFITYAQMAWVQLCANHVQHIECLSRATCRVPVGTKGQLSY